MHVNEGGERKRRSVEMKWRRWGRKWRGDGTNGRRRVEEVRQKETEEWRGKTREARIRRSEINEVMTEMTGRRERKELNQVERVNPWRRKKTITEVTFRKKNDWWNNFQRRRRNILAGGSRNKNPGMGFIDPSWSLFAHVYEANREREREGGCWWEDGRRTERAAEAARRCVNAGGAVSIGSSTEQQMRTDCGAVKGAHERRCWEPSDRFLLLLLCGR